MSVIVFSYFLPCVAATDSTLRSHRTKTFVVMTRTTSSEVSTGLTTEIQPIGMIPHLVANLTDITSLCIYHQGSSDGRSFGLIPNNLIPIVFLPYDVIFILHRIPQVKNLRRHTPLFREMEHLRVAKVGKRFAAVETISSQLSEQRSTSTLHPIRRCTISNSDG